MARSEQQRLSPREEMYLRVAKEIVVKFIETGRVNLGSFAQSFAAIYEGVRSAVEGRSGSSE